MHTEWTAADQAWADAAMAEAQEQARSHAADHAAAAAWLKKMRRTHRRCTDCTDGLDGEPDGMGGSIGGTCQACNGSGWINRSHPEGARNG